GDVPQPQVHGVAGLAMQVDAGQHVEVELDVAERAVEIDRRRGARGDRGDRAELIEQDRIVGVLGDRQLVAERDLAKVSRRWRTVARLPVAVARLPVAVARLPVAVAWIPVAIARLPVPADLLM